MSVVITGVGLTCAAGLSIEDAWRRSCWGASGIGRTRRFDGQAQPAQCAGEVPPLDIVLDLQAPKNEKFMAVPVRLAVRSAKEAVRAARLDLATFDPHRVALYVGSGQTGLESAEFFPAFEIAFSGDEATDFANLGGRSSRALDPYFSLRTLANAGIGLLSAELGARGPSNNFVQDDTSGAAAVAAGRLDLETNRCDVAIVGAYDSLLTPSTYLTYQKAALLSRAQTYRPFDRHRDGLLLGEGAAFFVLERAADASRRGATIFGELVGVGCSQDIDADRASTCSDETVVAAIEQATRGASIDMVIAHGIGTVDGDRHELSQLERILGPQMPVTAFKGLTGYVGAATALVELVFGLRAAQERLVPPIAGHSSTADDCGLSLVVGHSRRVTAERPAVLALCRSWFGRCAAIAIRAPGAQA